MLKHSSNGAKRLSTGICQTQMNVQSDDFMIRDLSRVEPCDCAKPGRRNLLGERVDECLLGISVPQPHGQMYLCKCDVECYAGLVS